MEKLPDSQSLRQARKLDLYDASGQTVKFGDILNRNGKTVVVFIRHFFCGSCQAYCMDLASSASDEALAEANVTLVLIGCGGYQLINDYAVTTGFRGPIYADPSRTLFSHFGLISNLKVTPSGEQSRKYIANTSLVTIFFQSVWRGPMRRPQHIGKQGNISQLGGDFVFNEDGECLFASRMRHTQDHVDVSSLMKHAGVII